MKKWLASVAGFFRGLFSGSPAQAEMLNLGIQRCAKYIPVALEMSQYAAALITPMNPADDVIVALVAKWTLPMVPTLTDPNLSLGDRVRNAIRIALKIKYPEAETRQLNRAIELAYGGVNP